jgi:hypothetical protein
VGAGSIVVLESIATLLITIKNNLSNDIEEEKLQKPLFCNFKINKLISYYSNHEYIDKIDYATIYKQVIDLAEVSFEGEPLNGLQIMGARKSFGLLIL